ncbi:MAG TPA: HNH endonuclease signature motif containing protein [Galbitalea sp.]
MEPINSRNPDNWNSGSIPPKVTARAIANVDIQPDGCWISRYSTGSHGYAQIGWWAEGKSHMVLAHRAAWVEANGPVPVGMTLDHLCKVRRCVNPAHLRVLTNLENSRRVNGKDWPLGTCVNGHDASLLVKVKRRTKNGEERWGTTCGECVRASRARYAARKAVA